MLPLLNEGDSPLRVAFRSRALIDSTMFVE